MFHHAHFSFCPRCGGKRIQPFQENGVQCPDCRFVFFHNCASAVSAIIETPRGIVLIERQRPPKCGFYDVPGGFVGYRESLEEALVREVREEVNVEIENLRYMGSFPNLYRFRKVTYLTTDAFFTCRAVSLESLMPKEEVSRIVIRKAGRIDLERIGFDSTRQAIRKYRGAGNRSR